MYESRYRPLLSTQAFAARVASHVAVAAALIGISLAVGVLGYHQLAHLGWVDSLVNAAMILVGMGPVDPLRTTPAKLFAAGYALYAGFVLLISVGIIIAPVFHRVLHRFHLEQKSNKEE